MQVHDPRFYTRVLRDGSLGFGESYVDGWWDSAALDQTMTKILAARLDKVVRDNWQIAAHVIRAKVLNLGSVVRAFEVGEKHYDVGNDLYEAMLDKRLVYTCGYWKDAKTLDDAQEAKLDLICRKLDLKPGMTILELGCGWGGFAKFAAEHYGVTVTGYTVSKEQVALATERCTGLPVTIHLADYRDAKGTYDRVVSIGLMEHVGYKNYGSYMELADRCLARDGIAFVHTIAGNKSETAVEPWFHKYIFANALLPSLTQLGGAIEERFSLEDLHNIGTHYDPTLMAWYERFEAAWPRLAPKYGERFRRMWHYYLLGSAAGFRARYCQLYQMVLTRVGTAAPDCRKS
jgi:cyclopropane-fatty-acyl-phospholipid synthase